MNLVTKARRWLAKTFVGDLDHGGWISTEWPWNYWQSNLQLDGSKNEVVYACIQAYARALAQLPGVHIRTTKDGYDETVIGSPLQKAMHRPNSYQTRSDFFLNLVSSLLYEGNAYVLAVRDPNAKIAELHLIPPHACSAHVAQGEIFYHVSPDATAGLPAMLVPARDIGHVKLHTPHDPLRGETPMYAASLAVSINNHIMAHQSKFFENMSRPSGVIETDLELDEAQTKQLRQRWEEHSKGMNSGGVPILAWGLKWKPLSLNAVDAQLIEAQKMSVERIASVYGVPLPLIGGRDSAYNNVYSLIAYWKANGLGFVIEHIEQAMSKLFDLPYGERLELDVTRLLRLDELQEMEALTKGVTGGVLAPNEARIRKGLRKVTGGDMPRVQQQMVPLDYVPPEPTKALAPPKEEEMGDEMMLALMEAAAG